MQSSLELESITLAYGKRTIVSNVNLRVGAGELVCLVGPNGSGKSTIVRAASGLLEPVAGRILLNGLALGQWNRREMARVASFVLQGHPIPPLFTVRELVAMGRSPYLPFWGIGRERDRAVTESALEAFDLLSLADRRLGELSGGEQQRAILARALSQEPSLLVVDEPTTFLDIHHQVAVLSRLHRMARQSGMAVLSVLHDMNLAAAFADRLVLLGDGIIARSGSPAEVLNSEEFRRIYGTGMRIVTLPDSPERPVVLPQPPAAETDGAGLGEG